MRVFSSELVHNYGSYTFGYANYCLLERGDRLEDIYAMGYLPYTGSVEAKDTLYMARSARVPLKEFELTSENRRITKKFDEQFTKEIIDVGDFNADEAFFEFCLSYFKARHGEAAMPRVRLEFILGSKFISHIARYKKGADTISYVFLLREKNMEHYWFSFYDLSLTQQSLGMWLMLDTVREAKAAGLSHYYLGTVYGEKALYKTNFEPLEWWSGAGWEKNVGELRELSRSDHERTTKASDAFKAEQTLF